jgi:hypothetical protein
VKFNLYVQKKPYRSSALAGLGVFCIEEGPAYRPFRDLRSVPEDCRPREQVENHGRAYLVPSADQKIPVQPGWYLPPQKILLAENRFLQTRKGS